MLKGINGGGLVPYIKTLKEIEAMISHAHSRSDGPNADKRALPERWEEVLHMARMAPALLSCLHECQELLILAREMLEKGPNQDRGGIPNTELLEESGYVVDYCSKVLTNAVLGVKPADETIH